MQFFQSHPQNITQYSSVEHYYYAHLEYRILQNRLTSQQSSNAVDSQFLTNFAVSVLMDLISVSLDLISVSFDWTCLWHAPSTGLAGTIGTSTARMNKMIQLTILLEVCLVVNVNVRSLHYSCFYSTPQDGRLCILQHDAFTTMVSLSLLQSCYIGSSSGDQNLC